MSDRRTQRSTESSPVANRNILREAPEKEDVSRSVIATLMMTLPRPVLVPDKSVGTMALIGPACKLCGREPAEFGVRAALLRRSARGHGRASGTRSR